MNKALVFRIYPNKEQRILLAKTFGCARFIWNKMLSDKKESPFLCEVDSLTLANEQLSLEKAYKNFRNGKGKVGFPRFKSRQITNAYDAVVVEDLNMKDIVYVCECGNIMDRDQNAARNIRQEGIRNLGIA